MNEQREKFLAEQNAKLAAEYGIKGIPPAPSGACGQSVHFAGPDCCEAQQPWRQPTLLEEAEKKVGYHRQQAEKADQAAAFFRENPAFDMFVRLVRQGVIQI
jgi:hypothetical protein